MRIASVFVEVTNLFNFYPLGGNPMKLSRILIVLMPLFFSTSLFAQDFGSLIKDAEAKYQAKEYEAALALYEKAFQTGKATFNDYYNAACTSARLNRSSEAFAYLNKALEAGYLENEDIKQDPDLESLRTDPRWAALMKNLEEKRSAFQATLPTVLSPDTVITLPEPKFDGSVSVEKALKGRRSIRKYLTTPLTLAEVSQILWSAYGITKTAPNLPAFLRGGLRTAASAGALFPLDIYLVAFSVDGLDPGIYYYNSEKHTLERIAKGDRRKEISEANYNQSHFTTTTAVLVYSAVFERTTKKYGTRGRERYVCMDLGHSAENVYLQAFALDIGTCAIGAFDDLALKKAVGMTQVEEPLYVMPLGKVK
jgi:SagB-type dehydrogenase family enzyme